MYTTTQHPVSPLSSSPRLIWIAPSVRRPPHAFVQPDIPVASSSLATVVEIVYLHTRTLIVAILSSRGEIRHSLTRKSSNHVGTRARATWVPVGLVLHSSTERATCRQVHTGRLSALFLIPGPSHSQKEAESFPHGNSQEGGQTSRNPKSQVQCGT